MVIADVHMRQSALTTFPCAIAGHSPTCSHCATKHGSKSRFARCEACKAWSLPATGEPDDSCNCVAVCVLSCKGLACAQFLPVLLGFRGCNKCKACCLPSQFTCKAGHHQYTCKYCDMHVLRQKCSTATKSSRQSVQHPVLTRYGMSMAGVDTTSTSNSNRVKLVNTEVAMSAFRSSLRFCPSRQKVNCSMATSMSMMAF